MHVLCIFDVQMFLRYKCFRKKSVVILARYSLAIEEGVNGARVVTWKTASDWSTPKVAYVEDFFRRKQVIPNFISQDPYRHTVHGG